MMLTHLAARLYGVPLLVTRTKLDLILAVLGERIDWPVAQAAVPLPPPRAEIAAPAGIALIPIHGTLTRRSLGLDAASGLTSYGELTQALDAAIADPAVSGILLDIDSPGGEAGGVFELAQRIRAADAVKPVWAVASDSAFSAAYALACAASRIYVTQTGGVGSIGVIAMHVDQSARDAQQGLRYTALTAGAQKDAFSPHQPLDPAATARLQAEVDRLYALFVTHVAAMRRLDADAVRATEAGLYFGPEAVAAGLADAEGSVDQALADFTTFLAARRVRTATAPGSSRSALLQEALPMTTAVTEIPEVPASPGEPDPTPPAPDPAAPDSPATVETAVNAAVAAAVATTRAEAIAVAELCALAGQPQRTAAFLAAGTLEAEVRTALLAARAEGPEITSRLDPNASAKGPEHNPLLHAVKKLSGKD